MEQLKIDLTRLPRAKLKDIANEYKINLKDTLYKENIIDILFQKVPTKELFEISKDYIYAGRTSISFWKYIADEKTKNKINRSNLQEILTFLCDGENPFASERRPKITETPQIISANFLNDSLCRVLFVSLGKPRKIFEEYDYKIVYSTVFTNTLLHLDFNIFEVRIEYHLAKKIAELFFKNLNSHPGYEHASRQLQIDLKAVVNLKEALNGKMKDHAGKTESDDSIYDTIKRTKKHDIEDLWNEPQFQEDIKGLDTTASGIEFVSPGINDNITVEISTKQSSIFFRSNASEDDIKYVFDKLIGIVDK